MELNSLRPCDLSLYPNSFVTISTSEFRVEYLNPPFMSDERPVLLNMPSKIGFNTFFTVDVSIPESLKANSIKGAFYFFPMYSYLPHTTF
jgi:hypothetical protein